MLTALLTTDPRILAASLALLALAVLLGVLARARARRRAQEQPDAAESDERGGETSVIPLHHLASSVQVLDLEELLADEDAPAAAAARRMLEEPTSTAPDTFFPLPLRPAASTPPAAAAPAVAAAPAPRATVNAQVALPATAPTLAVVERPVPVRELALAWFEARGYRPSAASQAVRPIELVLRHRQDPSRAYAFVVERDHVDTGRATALMEHARSIGLTRLLVAAEGGVDHETRRQFRRQGVRLVDQAEMQREFERLEISIAAKIIAVARSRSRARPLL